LQAALVLLGVLTGMYAVHVGDLSMNWIVYLVGAAVMGMVVPYVARALGGWQRATMLGFFFVLQADASTNLIFTDVANPSGYNGLRVSLVFLMAALYAVSRVLQRGRRWTFHRPLVRGMLFFYAAALVSTTNAVGWALPFYGLAVLAMNMFIGLVACDICADEDNLRTAHMMMIVILLTQSLILIGQRFTGIGFDLTGEVFEAGNMRYPGTLGHVPSVVAQFLAITLMFAQNRLYSDRGRARPSVLARLALATGMFALALTLTRSSWIAFGLASLVLGAYWARRGAFTPRRLVTIAVIVTVLLGIAWPAIRDRLEADHTAAAEERWNLVFIALGMIKAHPFSGIGINCIRDRLIEFIPDWFDKYTWVYVPHNQYLIVAAETGILGLLAFVNVLSTGARAAVRCWRSVDTLISETGAVLAAAFAVMLWGMNLDFYGGTQMYVLLWMFLGFAGGAAELAARKRDARAT
jgi:hypothetical protein